MDAGSFTKFPVKKGEVIRVAQPKGSTIKAESGELWITQKNIQDDIFLTRGETYHVFGDGLLVAQAMEPSLMSMTRVKRSSFMGGWPAALSRRSVVGGTS